MARRQRLPSISIRVMSANRSRCDAINAAAARRSKPIRGNSIRQMPSRPGSSRVGIQIDGGLILVQRTESPQPPYGQPMARGCHPRRRSRDETHPASTLNADPEPTWMLPAFCAMWDSKQVCDSATSRSLLWDRTRAERHCDPFGANRAEASVNWRGSCSGIDRNHPAQLLFSAAFAGARRLRFEG